MLAEPGRADLPSPSSPLPPTRAEVAGGGQIGWERLIPPPSLSSPLSFSLCTAYKDWRRPYRGVAGGRRGGGAAVAAGEPLPLSLFSLLVVEDEEGNEE